MCSYYVARTVAVLTVLVWFCNFAHVQDYVVSVSKEAAEMGSFVLSEARPGAAPLDPAATLEAAGVAGAMLVIKSS